jgi:predicted Fe-Mo cluster-binding NifX family protein
MRQDVGMKTAFVYWNNRIAPVFDTARQIHLIETESGRMVSETQATLPEGLLAPKVQRLMDLDVGTLICGAISRPTLNLIAAYGIQVIPFVAGDLHKVIEAWRHGRLEREAFAMPGCPLPGQHRFGRAPGRYQEVSMINQKGRGRGPGSGQGQGQGQGRQRSGRKGGSFAAGSAGACVCPQCGHTEPHERGMPCVERKCPQCGTIMNRQF